MYRSNCWLRRIALLTLLVFAQTILAPVMVAALALSGGGGEDDPVVDDLPLPPDSPGSAKQ